MKIYAPQTAPQIKSIDQRCRELDFEYFMTDQSVDELFLSNYCNTVEDHFLGMVIDPVHNDILAKELSEMTTADLKGGLKLSCP